MESRLHVQRDRVCAAGGIALSWQLQEETAAILGPARCGRLPVRRYAPAAGPWKRGNQGADLHFAVRQLQRLAGAGRREPGLGQSARDDGAVGGIIGRDVILNSSSAMRDFTLTPYLPDTDQYFTGLYVACARQIPALP